ncbi:MAG: phospholipase domain-containing protein, partial [Ginsengibacter sp.]
QLSKLPGAHIIDLLFENKGKAGLVYHVYDLKHLDRIPRRYTVEAEKSLSDQWDASVDKGLYDLEVYGPNGYFQKFSGNLNSKNEPEITLDFNHQQGGVAVSIHNNGDSPVDVMIHSNAYDYGSPFPMKIASGKTKKNNWLLAKSGNWYDFSVKMGEGYLRRFAGRVETGKPGVSDPAMAFEI